MSGSERLYFDTNAAVALLNGDPALHALWKRGQWAGVSVVTVLEFLAWPQIEEPMRDVFRRFVERVDVTDLRGDDKALMSAIIELRRSRALKLPDAIVLASARLARAMLITRDVRLLKAAEAAGIEVWRE